MAEARPYLHTLNRLAGRSSIMVSGARQLQAACVEKVPRYKAGKDKIEYEAEEGHLQLPVKAFNNVVD